MTWKEFKLRICFCWEVSLGAFEHADCAEVFNCIGVCGSSLDFNLKSSFLWQDESLKQLQVVHQPWLLPSDTESEGIEAEQDKRE